MRFGILGPTRVWHEAGEEFTVTGQRLRALLARLLLDAGRLVSTGRLIDDLYGDQPSDGAANALQSQVSRLRRVLGAPELVEFHPAGYRLAVAPGQVDAQRFAELAAQGQQALAAGEHRRAAEMLREALDLWRGPALADVGDAPYAAGQMARLTQARLVALEERVEAELALGEHAPLVPELQELVAGQPLRERFRAQLMRALSASGRPAEALTVYEQGRVLLAEQLGADPSPELAAVHLAVLRGDGPPPSGPPPSRGLPAQLTSFVGREDELARVGKLLAEARLVTITGPGGAGKTRLAVEASGQYDSELCLVELASLGAGADVPHAVLTALGLRDAGLRPPGEGGPPPIDRLIAALADRRLLLVLDNCEQLISDVAGLADQLLRSCPSVKILATSREPLGLTGEALCPLSGLALPPAAVSAAEALTSPAIRLFAARAADVLPGFVVDEAALPAVRRICAMLDGLPLAIELASARLRSLPLAEVADRLDDRFALLSRGSRAAQPRHRTLRAVVGWSWELLDAPEQELARRLTVFAGGASLAAVEQVAGGSTPVVEVLASLVDKSLVEAAGGRYRMLNTVRAYGAERLTEAGETTRLRHRHARYYLDLLTAANPHLLRASQLGWLAQLDVERDNLYAAVRGAVAAGDLALALELVGALAAYWWLRGLRSEAATLAGEVLAAVGPEPPPGYDEEFAICVLTTRLVEPGPREVAGIGSVTWLLEKLDRPPRWPVLLVLSAYTSGPRAGELAPAERARQQRLISGDVWMAALEPVGIGFLQLWAGQLAQAELALEQGLARFRAIGERWGIGTALSALAEVAEGRGDRHRALALIDEALQLTTALGSTVDTSDLLRLRGDCQVRSGEFAAADADYRQAMAEARQGGAMTNVAAARAGLAELARRRGDLPEARRLAETALAECPTGWFLADETRATILSTLGQIAHSEGDTATAISHYRRAVSGLALMPNLIALTGALARLLELELAHAPADRVAWLLGVVEAVSGAGGPPELPPVGPDARATLGEHRFDAAYAAGAALSPSEAIEALAQEPPVTDPA